MAHYLFTTKLKLNNFPATATTAATDVVFCTRTYRKRRPKELLDPFRLMRDVVDGQQRGARMSSRWQLKIVHLQKGNRFTLGALFLLIGCSIIAPVGDDNDDDDVF